MEIEKKKSKQEVLAMVETMKRALLADAGPDPAATAVPEGEFGEAEPNEGEEEEPREEDAHVAEVD